MTDAGGAERKEVSAINPSWTLDPGFVASPGATERSTSSAERVAMRCPECGGLAEHDPVDAVGWFNHVPTCKHALRPQVNRPDPIPAPNETVEAIARRLWSEWREANGFPGLTFGLGTVGSEAWPRAIQDLLARILAALAAESRHVANWHQAFCESETVLAAERQRVAALEQALREMVGSGITLDDARLDYVTMQVDRTALDVARAILAPPKETP